MGKSLNEAAKNFIEDEEQYLWMFDKDGKLVAKEEESVAKLLEIRKGENQTGVYYVRTGRGDLYDPYGTYQMTRNTMSLFPFAKTEKPVFDLYIKYLKQSKSKFYTMARREYLNRRVK